MQNIRCESTLSTLSLIFPLSTRRMAALRLSGAASAFADVPPVLALALPFAPTVVLLAVSVGIEPVLARAFPLPLLVTPELARAAGVDVGAGAGTATTELAEDCDPLGRSTMGRGARAEEVADRAGARPECESNAFSKVSCGALPEAIRLFALLLSLSFPLACVVAITSDGYLRFPPRANSV